MTDITTLRDALQELVDRDCTIVDRAIEIRFASHEQAMRALRAAREAYRSCGSDSAPDETQAALRLTDEPQADATANQQDSRRALTFDHFRQANVARCLKWHPEGIESWSSSDWLTAVTGELGELASLLKMRNRERDGLTGNKFSPTDRMIADEIADVVTYLDLLAAALGVDMSRAVVSKFNEVSKRVGFSDRILEERHVD